MKDVYKQRAGDTIEACTTRAKIVKEMATGERPTDQKQAIAYLRDIQNGLGKLQELIDLG
jgi:hypothetical protein|tara:strand:+ start:1205 stop:1384 length:180 start_codon:yes stop_codon:yes gene_type:complete